MKKSKKLPYAMSAGALCCVFLAANSSVGSSPTPFRATAQQTEQIGSIPVVTAKMELAFEMADSLHKMVCLHEAGHFAFFSMVCHYRKVYLEPTELVFCPTRCKHYYGKFEAETTDRYDFDDDIALGGVVTEAFFAGIQTRSAMHRFLDASEGFATDRSMIVNKFYKDRAFGLLSDVNVKQREIQKVAAYLYCKRRVGTEELRQFSKLFELEK